jgi:hypothetical protein
VFFSTGSHVLVCVDAWDTVEFTKSKVMEFVGIDLARIKPEFMQFFEIENTGEEVFEKMALNNEYIWDILYKWELQRMQGNVNLNNNNNNSEN